MVPCSVGNIKKPHRKKKVHTQHTYARLCQLVNVLSSESTICDGAGGRGKYATDGCNYMKNYQTHTKLQCGRRDA